MGGPGSGRRPKLVVDNTVQLQDAAYKRFIYPAVMVDMKWKGAVISSRQSPGQVGYTTYALCEVEPDDIRDERVNLWMVRYEPSGEGLLTHVHSVPGTIECIGDKVVDGYALALIRLADEINYPEAYSLYHPDTSTVIEPLEDVYLITSSHSKSALFTFHHGIISSISYPYGITVTSGLESDDIKCMVVRQKPRAELLAIMPRWQWWDLLEVGQSCLTT